MILAQHLRNSSPWLSDFGRLFETAFQRVPNRAFRIRENERGWELEADFPGVAKDRLELEVRDNALHLGVSDGNGTKQTYRLPLGKHIDPTGISASLELGVLTVSLPKAAAVDETHRIEIN